MALKIVATPIGDPGDITLRAIEALRAAEVVIGEERAEASRLLKRLDIAGKDLRLLNEHSRDDDVAELLALCREKSVALVSDCGTPGFCDPGARLVAACRRAGVAVTSLPGASSLMCLLSLCGEDVREFWFRGFLPAERESRGVALREVLAAPRPVVLMDTPYRLGRLLNEIAEIAPAREIALGLDFTQATEELASATAANLRDRFGAAKREFALILFPAARPAATLGDKSGAGRRSGRFLAKRDRV
jgi:16S rRNA (cytidine1402-2'-O)-methyltransferase